MDYTSAEIQSVYSTAPANRAEMAYCHTQDSRWICYPPAEIQSVYSTAPADWTEMAYCHIQDNCWVSYPLQRFSRCIILQPQPTGLRWLIVTPKTAVGYVTRRQRFSRCILQPQPTGLRWHSVSSKTAAGCLTSLHTVGVFYSPNRLDCWSILRDIAVTIQNI